MGSHNRVLGSHNRVSNACPAAAHGGQVACEAELAVRAMYNLDRARAEPLAELAQLLHRRPKPPPEAAAPIPLPASPAPMEQTGAGGSLVELALRFAGRKLPSYSPSSDGRSQSTQLPRLPHHGTRAAPSSGSGPDLPLSAASRPSRGVSKSSLGPPSTVDVVLAEEGDDEEGAVAYGCEVPDRGGGAPRSSSLNEVGAAADAGARNGPCMFIGPSCSEAQTAAVLDGEYDRAPVPKMTVKALPGDGCEFSPPASAEPAEASWIAPGSGLEAVALRMGDFR